MPNALPSFDSFAAGQALVYLSKSAAEHPLVYALTGRLQLSDGWLVLSVPASLIRGAFDALHEPGLSPPRLLAIPVMSPAELTHIGGADKISERGHQYKYSLGHVRSHEPGGDLSKVLYLRVLSPELKKLRSSYGLSPYPKGSGFTLPIGIRRVGVLGPNELTKLSECLIDPDREEFDLDVITKAATKADEESSAVIYLARHGKTKFNTGEEKIRGWIDVPLTPEGKHEAEEAGEFFTDIDIERVLCSNLSRTESTARAIADAVGVDEIEPMWDCRPWHLGVLEGHNAAKAQPIIEDMSQHHPMEPIEKGENFASFKHRWLTMLEKVMQGIEKGEHGSVVLVTHFRNCKLAQAWLDNGCKVDDDGDQEVDFPTFFKNDLPTGVVLKLHQVNGKWIYDVIDPTHGERDRNAQGGGS